MRAQWGLTLRDGYGQTETTASVGNTPGSVVKPGSMGRPLPGVPVVLVDPLHLQRVGESPAVLTEPGTAAIGYAQLCDAMLTAPGAPDDLEAARTRDGRERKLMADYAPLKKRG